MNTKTINHSQLKNMSSRGFTIVELLVVIVVIGILASITIVSYAGISKRAVAITLQVDSVNAATQMKIFQMDNGVYPTTISTNCTASPTTTTNLCLKPSSGNSFTATPYTRPTDQTYTLVVTNGGQSYKVTENTSPVAYVPSVCPAGFIVVPGSVTYGTSDFCIMKYEAKNVGGVATSQAALTPWVYVSQVSLGDRATNLSLAACTGCHLVTEAEWMTVAQNVLRVNSNWSGGSVGSGFIYSGHNDSVPNNSLAADANDNNGYSGTGNVSPSNQRRTLTLSNGEVIWDLAGNVTEWTSGQTGIYGQPSAQIAEEWSNVEYKDITDEVPYPIDIYLYNLGISGAGLWTTANGIGDVYSKMYEPASNGFVRGGAWNGSSSAGVLSLDLSFDPLSSHVIKGFRAAK